MSVIEKLDSVLAAIDALKIEAREGFDIRAYLRMASSVERACYDHLRDHGPAIRQAMIDAEKWRFCTSEHELGDGQTAKMHINVGVNVWRGEEWLGFHECSPDEAREALDAARLASDSEGGDQNG